MDEGERAAVPGWYWVLAVLVLLWEAFGCFTYLTQVRMTPEALAALPAAGREIWLSMPGWATSAYAVAVWVGLAGAIALLLRHRIARTSFIVSLAALLVQFGWVFLATPIMETIGAPAVALPAVIVIAGIVLVWFCSYAIRRGWLR